MFKSLYKKKSIALLCLKGYELVIVYVKSIFANIIAKKR